MVVPCSEVAMSDAEKESEVRCKAMLNKLIAEVKRQTVEMEELAVRMDELAVGLKAVVQPPGAPGHALPPPVPAPTAICVTAVDHAVAAATPCAEAALAPELPTKCSTSGPDPNAGYAKVAAVSLLSRGATIALRAHAEPVNVTSSKSLATSELDNLMPARCSKMCSGDDTASPKSALMPDAAPGSPATAALLDVAITSPAPSLGAPRVCADTCIVAVHQLFDEMPPRVDVDHAVAEVTQCTDYALVNTHPYCSLPSVDAAEGSSWNPWHDQPMHQSSGGVVVVLQPWPPPTQEHLNWFNRFDERDQHEVIMRMLEVSGRQGRSSSCQVGSRLTIADGNPLYHELEVVEGMKLDRVVKVLELRSVGASSPTVQTNVASIDWLGSKQVSRVDSSSHIAAHAYQHSHSFDAAGTALDSAPSGRPWERGDLILRLATFKPLTWASEPKAASSLARTQKGWVNIDMDKIECESCGAPLIFSALTSWSPAEVANAGEAFAEQLDASHQNSCPWRGNSCADSLVQLHLTQSALIGGFKEHCDGLLQFVYLPVIASSAIENMRLTKGLCGATVRIWDFRSVPRPSCFSPNSIDASAASGINEGVADGMERDHAEGRDEAANEESKFGVVLISVSYPLVEQLTNGVPNTEAAVEVPVLKDTLNVENEVPAVGKEVHPPLEQTSVIVTEIPSLVKETRILKQVPVPLHQASAILTESPPLKDTPAITIEQLPPVKENTATLKESPIEETPPKEAVTLSDSGTRMSFPPVIAQNVQSQNADGIAKKSTTRELAVENHDSTANVNDSISLIASYPASNARLGENVMNKGSGSSDKTPVNAASSFQFFVIADEGLDLFVDLNSTPSDWVDSLKEEVCIPPGIHHSEPGNFSSFISSLASKDHHNTISPSGNIIVDKQNGGAEGIAPCTNSSLGSTGGENSRSEPYPPDTTAVNSLSSASTLPGTLVEISGSQEGVPVVSSCLTSNVQNNLSSDMMADALNNKVLPQESVDVSVWSERSNASLADDIIQPTGNKDTVSAGKTKVSVKIGCTQNVLVADTDKAAAFSSGDVVKSDSENSCPTSVGKQEMIDVPAGAQLTHNSDTHEVLMENEPVEAVPMEEDLGYGDMLSIG